MRTILLSLLFCAILPAQTAVTVKKTYSTFGTGLLAATQDGVKIVNVLPGFSWFAGGDTAQLMTSHCSASHSISEEPTTDTEGRFVFRVRPNPAIVAVYRGGVRLEPNIHYKLVYLEDGKLPDRFELTAAAPPSGKVIVDYVIGTSSIL